MVAAYWKFIHVSSDVIHLSHCDHLVEAVDLVQDSHAAAIQQPVANLAVTALPLFKYIYN